MQRLTYSFFIIILSTLTAFAQDSIDASFSQADMHKDLTTFRNIRTAANSGVYTYRTMEEIDSIYNWATQEIKRSSTLRDFYNIISTITDFEGSLHNGTLLPTKVWKKTKEEKTGYFPYPVKLIAGKLVINSKEGRLPLGTEIVAINGQSIADVLPQLHKYHTTDGFNLTGKKRGINRRFSLYYRMAFGLQTQFDLKYRLPTTDVIEQKRVEPVSFKIYVDNFKNRHSQPFDATYYSSDVVPYEYELLSSNTAKFTINSFDIGSNETSEEHIEYTRFLDSIFTNLKTKNIQNLIVDVRANGGGTDPNDMVTYAYLTNRAFQENTEAWISFRKIPYWKYIKGELPFWTRIPAKIMYTKQMRNEFDIEKNGRYYQNEQDEDKALRYPQANAFKGQVYLLLSPKVASAGSMFAAMLASTPGVISIGEETQGGYYGHNGHFPAAYRLPKSNIKTVFSIVNLQQDVPKKANQNLGSGVRPDHYVEQGVEDFLINRDTQLQYTLDLIKMKQ